MSRATKPTPGPYRFVYGQGIYAGKVRIAGMSYQGNRLPHALPMAETAANGARIADALNALESSEATINDAADVLEAIAVHGDYNVEYLAALALKLRKLVGNAPDSL